MGFVKMRLLKPGAIPSITTTEYLENQSDSTSKTDRANRVKIKERKDLVNKLIEELNNAESNSIIAEDVNKKKPHKASVRKKKTNDRKPTIVHSKRNVQKDSILDTITTELIQMDLCEEESTNKAPTNRDEPNDSILEENITELILDYQSDSLPEERITQTIQIDSIEKLDTNISTPSRPENLISLKDKNKQLEVTLSNAQAEIIDLKQRLYKTEFHLHNLESKFYDIFTPTQVKKMKQGSHKTNNWSDEDIARSIAFYSTSPRTYKLLRRKDFPLPAIRTLKSWAHRRNTIPGIISTSIEIMQAAKELTQHQRICVLSFGEMKIKEAYCYDRSTDTTLKPASYVQVCMLRGLLGKWMQPVFYDFDSKMSKEILTDILEKIFDSGFTVVAITSDLANANRELSSKLGVSMDRPWFLFKEVKIFVFVDIPHLIKRVRNYFVDHGFVINGKHVKKQIILKLIATFSRDLGATDKISIRSVNVAPADRQDLNLATELFSDTVAKALLRAISLGLFKDECWEECYKLIKYTSDWFDLMNAKSKYSDSKAHAYGLNLESQDILLNNITKMMSDLRVAGITICLPFQKSIVQSNTALQLLQQDMKERFDVGYILTSRLNHDVLENFFDAMRTSGELNDPPDRQEFKNKLRSYILGHNEEVLPANGCLIAVDDKLEEKCLSGTIFSSLKLKKLEEFEPEKHLSIEYDNLEKLTGYICQQLKQSIREVSTNPTNWVHHSNEKEEAEILQYLLQLENVFNAVNGDGDDINISSQYIKHLIEISKKANIVCEEKIKYIFFRSRMYFRLRRINGEIVET